MDYFSILDYKKNSYIMVEGDTESDLFYIIKTGKVESFSSLFYSTKSKGEIMKTGGFFGVVSAMSGRSRTATVQTLEDTRVIAVHRSRFINLITQNTPIAMKIIRRFSQKLRYYDSILMALYANKQEREDPRQLVNLAEYYEKVESLPKVALLAYRKYLEHCPNGKNVPLVREKVISFEKIITLAKPVQEGVYWIYQDEQVLFFEHENGDSLYLVQEGEVEISKVVNRHKVLLAILGSGAIVGEMSILDNLPRNATAIARGRVKVMKVTQENFEHVVVTYPQIADKIIRFLSDRIWLIHRKIANALISDPELRIYDALYTELLKQRMIVKNGGYHEFDFTVEDLMEQIGLDKDRGKLILREMVKKESAFEIAKDRHLVCRDISKIEENLNPVRRNLQIRENIQKMTQLL